MDRSRRFLAAVSLLVLAVTEIAPHRHADSPFEWSQANENESGEVHVYRCDGLNPGVSHVHRDQTRAIDPCLACLRLHLQATASITLLGTPQMLARFAPVVAHVSHARAMRYRQSSRAPPVLPS